MTSPLKVGASPTSHELPALRLSVCPAELEKFVSVPVVLRVPEVKVRFVASKSPTLSVPSF